ncbi:MAG TPA: FtsX-like permease family protein [Phycisphaerae bacterium]|nr:FtsX-like permease family protein [Phycisphaerae bacterium]
MFIALRLAVRQWLARPVRPLLCSLAIAAAVALIICCGAAFESLRYSFHVTVGQMLGVAEIHIRTAQRGTQDRLPQSLFDQLQKRPEVETVSGRMQAQAGLTKGDVDLWFDSVGVDPKRDEELRPKIYNSGHALTGAANEIVIDAAVANSLHAQVGDVINYTSDGMRSRKVTVVGIVKRPTIEIISKPTIYLPIDQLAKDLGTAPAYDVIDLKLRDSAGIEDLDAYAKRLHKELGPGVTVTPGVNSKSRLANESETIELGLTLLSIVSGLCAALIIGTTLSVGVQERVRQFGQLRCIGASRRQLAVFLSGDALVMLMIGEALGLVLGFVAAVILIRSVPQFFLAFRIAPMSVVIAVINGAAATAVGALIPMWQVTRVSPMAAVTSVGRGPRRRFIGLAAFVGVVSIALEAALWAFLPGRDVRIYGFMFVGVPLIFAGWTLLGPALLMMCERGAAAVIGVLLRIRPAMLRGAWSRTPWRASAMVAALMIGVTLFTAVRARGQSVLASWSFPSKFPDLFLLSLAPMNQQRVALLKKEHPEIRDLTTLAAFPIKLRGNAFKDGDLVGMNGANFVCVEPESFARLVEMHYDQGDPRTAIHELAEGGHIFVTSEFYHAHGLGVGDQLHVLDAHGKPVTFTIAAVVSSTGMDLVKNYFDMRSTFQDAAVSTVMGSVGDAKKYFGLSDVNLMLLDVTPQTINSSAMGKLRLDLQSEGYQTASSVDLKANLNALISRIVGAMSLIAAGALAVASLGVANMVIASVHARRYEFGVLRAIGAGRWQLIRLVLAEVSLIGGVAGVLGAAAGLELAYSFTLVDRMIGLPTRFLAADPWQAAGYGAGFMGVSIGLTIVLAWVASIWPAARGAFVAQRSVLASGRG